MIPSTSISVPDSDIPHDPGDRLLRWVPRLIFATATVHTVYAFAAMPGAWGDIARAGVVNGIGGDPERESALWFFYAGIGLYAIGSYARHAARTQGRIPWQVAAYQLGIGSTMAVLQPASGAWLVLLGGALSLAALRRRTTSRMSR